MRPGKARRHLDADHAGARPRQDRAHRQPRRRVEIDHTAVGLGQIRRRGDAERCQPVGNAANIEGHDRPDIRVDYGRGQPLNLAELGRHLVRGANEGFREFVGDDAPRRGLVRGIKEAVEKADGDRLDAGIPQNAHCVAYRSLVEHGFDAPIVAQPVRHFKAQPAFDEHRRLVCLQIVEIGSFFAGRFRVDRGSRHW